MKYTNVFFFAHIYNFHSLLCAQFNVIIRRLIGFSIHRASYDWFSFFFLFFLFYFFFFSFRMVWRKTHEMKRSQRGWKPRIGRCIFSNHKQMHANGKQNRNRGAHFEYAIPLTFLCWAFFLLRLVSTATWNLFARNFYLVFEWYSITSWNISTYRPFKLRV